MYFMYNLNKNKKIMCLLKFKPINSKVSYFTAFCKKLDKNIIMY